MKPDIRFQKKWRTLSISIMLCVVLAGCTLRDSTATIVVTAAIGPGPTVAPGQPTHTPGAPATITPGVAATAAGDATVVATPDTSTATQTPDKTQPTPASTASPSGSGFSFPELTSPLPAASIPLDTIFGIEVSSISSTANLPLVNNAGARWIRRAAVPWRAVEPEEGARNWAAIAYLEQEFMAATAQGFKLIIVVREAPPYAQSIAGSTCSAIKREKFSAFAAFMRDMVLRYSAAPYNVRYWEIWNEPDIDPRLVAPDSLWGCWGDEDDTFYGGGYYAEMLKAIYPVMKQAEPEAQVLVGGLLLDCDPRDPPAGKDCKPSLFLEGIMRNGGGDFFDGVAFHAYDYYEGPVRGDYFHPGWNSSSASGGPVVAAKAQFVRETLFRYGRLNKFLMNTEMALVCGRDGKEPQCLTVEFNETKAAYAVQSYLTSLAQGLRAAIWFTLTGWRGSGLVDDNMQPNATYAAYRYAAQQFQGVTRIVELQPAPGVRGYELQKRDTRVWVLWSTDKGMHNIALNSTPQSVLDLSGMQINGGSAVFVGPMPIYIQW